MNISNIINEEIKNILTEGWVVPDEGQFFTFKQQFVHGGRWEYVDPAAKPQAPSFTNYETFTTDYDVDVTESDITVDWQASFWVTEMGIENFSVHILGVGGQFTLEMRNRQSDAVEQESVKDISEQDWRFMPVYNNGLDVSGAFYITNIEFDFENNVCTVTF